MRISVIISATVVLAACSQNKFDLSYRSQPESAQIICSETNYGYSPVTLQYKVPDEAKKQQRMRLPGCYAYWPSGATSSVPYLDVDLSIGNSQQFTFVRPNIEQGRDLDFNMAVEMERNRMLQKQISDEKTRQAWKDFGDAIRESQKQSQIQNRSLDCYSRTDGAGNVSTDCYEN